MNNTPKAYDVDGFSDKEMLEHLEQEGPPFLFASPEEIKVGFRFRIGDQYFVVIRMTNATEYIQRHGEKPRYFSSIVSFYEAVTD